MPYPLETSPLSMADAALLESFFGPEASDVLGACEGSWQAVMRASRDMHTPAGRALCAALEIVRRALCEELQERSVLDTPEKVATFLRSFYIGRPYEVFVVLYLDAQNRLIRAEEAFVGTITQCVVFPREIVRRALELGSAGVVFSHNHPSGVAEPSRSDRQITETLTSALATVDVRVLDHLLVTAGQCVSFAELGLI